MPNVDERPCFPADFLAPSPRDDGHSTFPRAGHSTVRGLLAACAALVCACGAATGEAPSDDASTDAPEGVDAARDDAQPADTHADFDAHDASPTHDAAIDTFDAAPACTKHLTVLFSVGVGAGALAGHTNGCWDVVDADGAANHTFRKCSTSTFVVVGPDRPNYSYDDTNPSRPLSEDEDFLSKCASGATGDGYEFMAYRDGWRLLGATHLRGFFAELYGDATDDVDSLWSVPGVYEGNKQLAGHHVYPMINVGPPLASHLEGKIEKDALAICKTIADGGYFGTYVATWSDGMDATDPRVLALAKALDACTKK